MNTYCINLNERREKWENTKIEASKLGITPRRFPAIKKSPGYVGCRITHRRLLTNVKSDGVFMVIEDDIKVNCDNPGKVMGEAITQLPEDWDMLYLGATLNQPLERYSENLYRIKRGWTTHAIIYNNQNGVVDFILKNRQKKIDVFYADVVQDKFNCFITYPMVLTQREGFSDVINKPVDYEVIGERYRRYVNA